MAFCYFVCRFFVCHSRRESAGALAVVRPTRQQLMRISYWRNGFLLFVCHSRRESAGALAVVRPTRQQLMRISYWRNGFLLFVCHSRRESAGALAVVRPTSTTNPHLQQSKSPGRVIPGLCPDGTMQHLDAPRTVSPPLPAHSSSSRYFPDTGLPESRLAGC